MVTPKQAPFVLTIACQYRGMKTRNRTLGIWAGTPGHGLPTRRTESHEIPLKSVDDSWKTYVYNYKYI